MLDAIDRPAAARIWFIVPTRGTRETLVPLLDAIISAKVGEAGTLIAVNGELNFAEQSPAITVWPVPSGYSSSRNEGAHRAMELGATGLIFIDDDVVVKPHVVRDFVEQVRDRPENIIGLPVEKRIDSSAGKLARRVLRPTIGFEQYPDSLPASFLYVPSSVFDTLRFPPALDQTGGEDTALTHAAFSRGFCLERLEHRAHEVHPPERLREDLLIGRLIASQAVRRVLARDTDIASWTTESRSRSIGWVFSTLAAVSKVSSSAGYALAVALGRFLGRLGYVPATMGGVWTCVRRIRA